MRAYYAKEFLLILALLFVGSCNNSQRLEDQSTDDLRKYFSNHLRLGETSMDDVTALLDSNNISWTKQPFVESTPGGPDGSEFITAAIRKKSLFKKNLMTQLRFYFDKNTHLLLKFTVSETYTSL